MDFDQAAAQIDKAQRPEDLFGYVKDDPDHKQAQKLYRKLARIVHPDTAGEWRRVQAEAIFAKLGRLYAEQTGAGTGDGRFTLTTRKRTYVASRAVFKDEITTTYPCLWMEDDEEHEGLMKMPRSPRDSDLMQAEAEALRKIHEGDERWHPFVPELVESFRHRDLKTKTERRVNVTVGRPTGWYSLAEVHDAYWRGLHPKDAAWMWRRVLTVLGAAHACGLVHGAVVPENILILPEKHGLMLVNWCYSVPMNTAVRAIPKGSHAFMPPEVLAKEPATQATDIYVASKVMLWLMGERAPVQLRSFVKGCTLGREAMRPHDAWKLLREYDDLLERLYGKRKFRAFRMPG